MFVEISANFFHDYPGQALRMNEIETEQTPLCSIVTLHAVAEATFHSIAGSLRAGTTAAEILAATALVGQAGFTICDDVAHGFGGG